MVSAAQPEIHELITAKDFATLILKLLSSRAR